ncbi:MAG: class I SAM-dependent methyltransferase [Chloroflexi bacterium]|nr:class I SAM-dependent methyltransferase [Chloroflexota bacterium]
MKLGEYRRMYELEDQFWWYAGMRRAVAALLDASLPPQPARRILDAGCGTGKNLEFLRRYGCPVGIDLAAEALQLARCRNGGPLVRASITALPFPDSTFDLVTSFEVIYHLAVSDDRLALAELARVTRLGGWVLVRVPAYDWLRGRHDRAVHTRHRYIRGELVAKLAAVGLRVRRASYLNSVLFPVAAAKRVYESLAAPQSSDSDLQPVAPALNQLLTAVLAAEGQLLRRWSLPFGLSVIALASKD